MNQDNLAQLEADQEQAELEKQLRESVAAEEFFERESGKLVVALLTKEINVLVKQVISEKFLKDHMGYVNAVLKIQANQGLLKRLQVAASPVRRSKIQERLDISNGL